MPCEGEDTTSFMLRNWIGKGGLIQIPLGFAIEQGRCLFTFNVKDFVILHKKHAKSGQVHWGIIVSKQLPFRETMSRLLRLLRLTDKATMKNRLEFL